MSNKFSINLIPVSRQASVMIAFVNGVHPMIYVSYDATFMQHIPERLRKAGSAIAKLSFPWRYRRFVFELISAGKVELGNDIYLTDEGIIEAQGQAFSIRDAFERGSLLLGTYYKNWSGRVTENKPNEVFIGHDVPSRSKHSGCKFEVFFNVDVVLSVLQEFATSAPDAVYKLLVNRATAP